MIQRTDIPAISINYLCVGLVRWFGSNLWHLDC
jgi:hypothetical protein